MPSPQRGEVWLVDLGLAAKVRPAAKLVRRLGRLSVANLAAVERVVSSWLGLPVSSPEA